MDREKREHGERCMIYGEESGGRKVCERCRESLALCDIENFVLRKTLRKKSDADTANAFK